MEATIRPLLLGTNWNAQPRVTVQLNPPGAVSFCSTNDPGACNFTTPSTTLSFSTNYSPRYYVEEAISVTGPWVRPQWVADRGGVRNVNSAPFSTNGNYVIHVPRTNAASTIFYRLKKVGT